MADSNESPVSQTTTADTTKKSRSEILAMIRASREKGFTSPRSSVLIDLPPAQPGVSAHVAAQALLEIDEERLREELQNPDLTEEERVQVFKQLRGIESSRIWHEFQEKVTNSLTVGAAEEDSSSKSEDGKKGEE
ncbi:hypothetical protein B0J18DRAFT_410569 [Chaetomium sp. MPI-SDFR-AT-0129]|nr:hypothetical protein B0J18DRAFT_410569 [Chaetomium sp. MPI-SDFR-AT-0129]